MTAAGPVTLLFTDLVNSTELLDSVADERAQRIFQAHHKLLKTAVATHGGQEVKWLGDGLMTAFVSTADAVRCAIVIQQTARRRAVGERLVIRVGLHVGEALLEETDYFGTPVMIARRLCDRAQGGEILCSALVAGLLAGRQAFTFRDCGALEIKGLALPMAASEVLYQHDEPMALLTHTPFMGRGAELATLTLRLQAARAGQGGLVLLAGEPGIGKTRLAEEFAESAREHGATVLMGRCYDGEWTPPYGPFAEAIADYAGSAEADELRRHLGPGVAPLARLVPALRERLPDVPEPVALQPDEERFRLLDAVVQFLIALATRAPVVLVVDDLHWADKGTISMLRHVARFAPRNRILLLGSYRNAEVDRAHPLTEALGALPRETAYEHLALTGLTTTEIEQLLEAIADQEVPEALVTAISAETNGNPFFIREVLLHLAAERKVFHHQKRWTANLSIEQMGIPESVRQVIARRLARLSEPANRLLGVAAGFNGAFRFDIAARVAGLEEVQALDAVDEALGAQLLAPLGSAESCDFTHALVRHTLYEQLSPPRQARLHRRIAEVMDEVYSERAAEHAGEIAEHYRRSAALPGAERGVRHALAAADRAEAAYAPDEVVTFLRLALELLPPKDPRHPRILGRLGLALVWVLDFEEALRVACQAGDLIAASEGNHAAADYLAVATVKMKWCGFARGAWALAAQGLAYAAGRRDATWATLMVSDIVRREAEDPESPGIAVESVERRVLAEVVDTLPQEVQREFRLWRPFRSRAEILASRDIKHMKFIGEYRRDLHLWEGLALQAEQEGQIALAVWLCANVARCHNALGNLATARAVYDHGVALAKRLPTRGFAHVNLRGAADEMQLASDEGWDALVARTDTVAAPAAEEKWAAAAMYAAYARILARLGRREPALQLLAGLVGPLERAPGWAENYNRIACDAAAVLWSLERTDYIDVLQRNLREKVVAPDFRCPMQDGRLALARLCALEGRYDEAVDWFTQARAVLDEQGARPLRAIVDFDEALMYLRRGAAGDSDRAAPLLETALQQFREIGMRGWSERAEQLLAEQANTLNVSVRAALCEIAETRQQQAEAERLEQQSETNLFRHEGEYWTFHYQGTVCRLRDRAGLGYLAVLLERPHAEVPALTLVAEPGVFAPSPSPRVLVDVCTGMTTDLGEVLDSRARAEYRERLDDLAAEIEEAEGANDVGRVERLRTEHEALQDALGTALGLGGRARRSGSPAERARVRVTRALREAISRIRAAHKPLGEHLGRSLRTGTFCSYNPSDLTVWTVVHRGDQVTQSTGSRGSGV